MIGFFLPIASALLAGYITAVAAYYALMFVITRLGRKLLMNGDRVSGLYTVLLSFTWFVAAFAGAYICDSIAPSGLEIFAGNIVLPVLLAVSLVLIVLRNRKQLPGQQSGLATVAIVAMMSLGVFAALEKLSVL